MREIDSYIRRLLSYSQHYFIRVIVLVDLDVLIWYFVLAVSFSVGV